MAILAAIWRIASITIPLPIAVLVAIGVWWQVDKHSAVRKAVTELVASSELEAERAKTTAANLLLDEVKKQRDALETANKEFEADVAQARAETDAAERDLEELKKRPVDGKCAVDDDVFGRLRSR